MISRTAVNLLLFVHFFAAIRLFLISSMFDAVRSKGTFESAIGDGVGPLRSVGRNP